MGLNIEFKATKAEKSDYNPGEEAQTAIAQIRADYSLGHTILNRPYEEFNGLSIVEEVNANRKSFNSYVPPRSDDPDDSWRAQTVRPIVRAKLISIAAHVTAQIIIPKIFAQNNQDNEDKESAKILGDLMEWAIENSNYEREFINAVITALVDPIVYVRQDFRKVMRNVKQMNSDGTWTKQEILDEVMSGFATNVLNTTDVYFANIKESDIQKQRFIITRKNIEYGEAKSLYGDHKDFSHVSPGVQVIFINDEATFYAQEDQALQGTLVEEVRYENRLGDLDLVTVNGILVTDPEQPMKRLDKRYSIAKTGYEPINDGKFFLYKSAANKIGYDEDLINQLYNYVMDGTFLALMPPMAMYGDEEMDGSSIMVPGAITSLGEESRLDSIAPKSDLRAGLEAINVVEGSISESTQDSSRSGVAQGGDRTAFEVATLEQNAKTALGLFGKFIGFLVEDLGTLILGDIVQFMTVPMIQDISSVDSPLKYKTIVVPDRIEDGKKFSRKIEFSDKMLGSEDKSPEELLADSFALLEEEGMDGDVRISKVNPELIRTVKTKVTVTAEQLTPRSKALEKALDLELYDRAIQNPISDIEAVTRDFLFEPSKPGDSDKYIKKQESQPNPLGEAQMNEQGGVDAASGVTGNLTGQMTGSNSLKNAQMQG